MVSLQKMGVRRGGGAGGKKIFKVESDPKTYYLPSNIKKKKFQKVKNIRPQ